MTLASNSLSVRADAVRALVAESDAAHLTSIEKAMEAGHELLAAKSECKHGEWLQFLERAGVHKRHAQRLMRLAESGLKSDTVSLLGGIKAALEFLAKRKLPGPSEGLCITPHSGIDNPFEAYEAVFVWPSRHAGYYHAAYFCDGENGGMQVTYTKRPVAGKPLPGDRESLVWAYEERMATPIEDRHYHRLSLPAVFAIADALGIADCMYEASRDQFEALEKAQSARTLEALSDMYGDAIERLEVLIKDRTIANYAAATEAMNSVSDAIQSCEDAEVLTSIAGSEKMMKLAARADALCRDD